MATLASRAFMTPRACLFTACVLLLCAVSCLPTPTLGSSLLLGGGGFVLSRPLLLQGVDVGAVLSAVQAALQTAQEDIAELRLENAQLKGELTEANRQLAEQASSLTLHAAQLESLEQFQGRAEATFSALNATMTDHGARLASAESNVTELDVQLTRAETAASALTVRVTETEAAATVLSARVAATEGDIGAQGARLSAAENLNGTATPLSTTLAGLRDLTLTSAPLVSRFLAAESGLASLSSTVAGQGTRLTEAENAAAALTTRIAAAEGLNGLPTTLTTTVLALRDLTGGSALVTTVTGLRDNSGSSALVTTLGSLRNKTDSSSALIRSLPCYGETSSSMWQVYHTGIIPDGLYVNVSIAACGFTAPPQHVSASLYGTTNHWKNIGASNVYEVTATSFRIFIVPTGMAAGQPVVSTPQTPEQVAGMGWRINWMAGP